MTINNLQKNLTVTVCTLNEEKNIRNFLRKIGIENFFEVIVVDGNSDDQTREIAESLGAKVLNVGRNGLAYQRNLAVEATKSKYVALLDADHRVSPEVLDVLITELEKYKYTGIEAQIKSENNLNYWDTGMELNFEISHNFPGARRMIGTPCIYRTEVLKKINYNKKILGPSDDTDLCYRLVKNGYTLGVGTPVVYQIHRSTFKSFVKKWIWYGTGDAQFIIEHPERFFSIIKHQIYTYTIKKSLSAVSNKKIKYIPFFVMCGLLRFVGMLIEFIKIVLRFDKRKRIFKS